MAAPVRRKKRRRAGGRGKAGAGVSSQATRRLRRLDDPLTDWRFEPKASRRSVLAVVLLSLGGVALGVGVYGQWFRGEALEALAYAPYVLGAGAALVVAYFIVGGGAARVLRVGDLGVGFEAGAGGVQRTPWHELSSITLAHDALRLATAGRTISLSISEHGAGVRRLLAEASRRIPKKLDVHSADLDRIGEPSSSDGEEMTIDPPQVTGQRCMSTDEPLTFERDVRMCGRCAALYHKKGVPRRCAGCGTKLRG